MSGQVALNFRKPMRGRPVQALAKTRRYNVLHMTAWHHLSKNDRNR